MGVGVVYACCSEATQVMPLHTRVRRAASRARRRRPHRNRHIPPSLLGDFRLATMFVPDALFDHKPT
jgi:hypothetical protein